MKLAMAEIMAAQLKEKPVILMDEIFAELDSGRSESLIHQLDPECQVFIASAHENDITRQDGFKKFRVDDGLIVQE
ncbi:TPA: hypothetical protein DCG35_04950 [Candidatus Edwardsbacteria bacterium]|nr:hypothetical protein [Candidatus Edwardsbacteria bacterium]